MLDHWSWPLCPSLTSANSIPDTLAIFKTTSNTLLSLASACCFLKMECFMNKCSQACFLTTLRSLISCYQIREAFHDHPLKYLYPLSIFIFFLLTHEIILFIIWLLPRNLRSTRRKDSFTTVFSAKNST